MNPELELRPFRPDDTDAAIDLWVRARWDSQPWLEKRMGYSAQQDRAQFRDYICRKFELWVADRGSFVLGWMALSNGQIEYLYVDPVFHRRGVGTALLHKAREANPNRLSLYTHQRNEGACAFYESNGFVPVEYGISPPPENEPDVRYEWSLDGQLKRAAPPAPSPN